MRESPHVLFAEFDRDPQQPPEGRCGFSIETREIQIRCPSGHIEVRRWGIGVNESRIRVVGRLRVGCEGLGGLHEQFSRCPVDQIIREGEIKTVETNSDRDEFIEICIVAQTVRQRADLGRDESTSVVGVIGIRIS